MSCRLALKPVRQVWTRTGVLRAALLAVISARPLFYLCSARFSVVSHRPAARRTQCFVPRERFYDSQYGI